MLLKRKVSSVFSRVQAAVFVSLQCSRNFITAVKNIISCDPEEQNNPPSLFKNIILLAFVAMFMSEQDLM